MKLQLEGRSRFPTRRVDEVDIASLPLTPLEAFVLSQLDGATDLVEVSMVSALGPAELEPIAITSASERAPAEVEIDEERRALIDDTHSRRETLSHYQLLDVDPSATRKEIKSAYFGVISIVHPDKYFGKELGSYKKKLDQVFERLTQAYEVLSRAGSREEYDRYAKAREATRSFDAVLTATTPPGPREPEPVVIESTSASRLVAQTPISAESPPLNSTNQRLQPQPEASPPVSNPEPKPAPKPDLYSALGPRTPRRDLARLAQARKFQAAGLESLRDGQ